MPPSAVPIRPFEPLARLASLLSRRPQADELTGEAAREAAEGVGAPMSLVIECLPVAGTAAIRGSYGWPMPPEPDAFAESASHISEALTTPAGRVIGDLASRSGEPALIASHGLKQAAAVPFGDPAQPFGVLAVYTDTHFPLGPDATLQVLTAIAALLDAGLNQARLLASLEREQDDSLPAHLPRRGQRRCHRYDDAGGNGAVLEPRGGAPLRLHPARDPRAGRLVARARRTAARSGAGLDAFGPDNAFQHSTPCTSARTDRRWRCR